MERKKDGWKEKQEAGGATEADFDKCDEFKKEAKDENEEKKTECISLIAHTRKKTQQARRPPTENKQPLRLVCCGGTHKHLLGTTPPGRRFRKKSKENKGTKTH